MGKDNISVSFGLTGMNRNSHQHLNDEKTYTFARNANLETDLDTIALTNEHSNLLCYRFIQTVSQKPQVVVGVKYDSLNQKIWFLLTDRDAEKRLDENGDPIIDEEGNEIWDRQSEIGYLQIDSEYNDEDDISHECGCDITSILSEPLENTTPFEHCKTKYTTLINDCLEANYCLNFDPNYPAHDIILKQEACGQTLHFAMKNNPLRYIITDNAILDSYKRVNEKSCLDPNEPDEICIDCEKLLVFPNYTQPYIQPEVINYGGSLKRGQYEFYIAYCDKLGNELTEYVSATNAVNIFDFNNIVLNQTTRFDNTSSAISLKVFNLDRRFNFYKIAAIERTDVNETTSAFIEGIHPITDTTIIYSSNGIENDTRISLNRLFMSKPVYKTFSGIVASNGYLFGYDYEVEKEWNLQPVVNLMGTFLKWQTVRSGEDLYKDGVNNALYKGYMRDEVYPFSIRFTTNYGYKTSIFPLIGRPSTEIDREYIPENYNKDTESIFNNISQTCMTTDRNERWQFYNTGSVLGYSPNTIVERINKIVYKNQTEDCIQKDVKVYTDDTITLNINEKFTNLKNWVQLYGEEILENNPDSEYYSEDLYEILTDDVTTQCDYEDIFFFPICEDEDECIEKYCNPNSEYYNEDKCKMVTDSCEDGKCYGVCSSIEKEDENDLIYINDIEDEVLKMYPRCYPWENCNENEKYKHHFSEKCSQFPTNVRQKIALNTEGLYEVIVADNEFRFENRALTVNMDDYYLRVDVSENKTCLDASTINAYNHFFTSIHSTVLHIQAYSEDKEFLGDKSKYSHEYFEITENGELSKKISPVDYNNGPDINELLSDVPSTVAPGFENKLSKSALWYTVDLDKKNDKLFEITPIVQSDEKDKSTLDGDVRITIYDNCNNNNILFSDVYDSKQGYWKLLKYSDFQKTSIKIAIDTPIVRKDVSMYQFLREDTGGRRDSNTFSAEYKSYMTSTLSGCFNVEIREVEYYKTDITFSRLTVDKKSTYSAQCFYNAPKNENCGIIPHQYGMFSYWESIEEYPFNNDLYDSRNVKIDISKLQHEDDEILELFSNEYLNIDQTLTENANFSCKKIRHFKFPDNYISPFMNVMPVIDFKNSEIFPIGVTIDERTVDAFLDFAVTTGLITKKQRASIIGYELFRGDRTVSRSIIMKGIVNDMYEDKSDSKADDKTYFRNFPYNSLGRNTFLSEDQNRTIPIDHPYDSVGNNRFSLISPDIYHSRPTPGTEMFVDGYMYGKAKIDFVDVEKHSEWVILGDKAYRQARNLALAEIAFESALNIATLTVDNSQSMWVMLGTSSGSGAPGAIAGAAAIIAFSAIQTAKLLVYKLPQLKAQWLQIFEDKGNLHNFAKMYVSDKGFYNLFRPVHDEGNILRGLQTSKYLSNGLDSTFETNGDKLQSVRINNSDRESSIYLNTGEDFIINYPKTYINYDNYNVSPRSSSRRKSSDGSCLDNIMDGKIASPYVTLKNYVPDQYGKIDEIRWISLNHNPLFGDDFKPNIFGGDIYLTRVDLKNKFPMFNKNAVFLGSRTPFKYSNASNVGYTTYYVDYKTSKGFIGDFDGSFVNSDYKLDCLRSVNEMYLGDPSKFYLFAYGIPYFMVESEINNEFRYAGVEPHEQFASRGLDVSNWVQESVVSIAFDNIFRYNSVYSRNQTGLKYRTLPAYYDKDKWDCLSESENGVAWSDPDNSEVSLSDPWLVFRPFNIYRFPFNYGKLIGLNNIESNQVVGRFTDNMTIFHAIDVLRDRITPDNETLGNGGIFASGRPVQFSYTDLGETGSQHKAFVSTEFGHFWVDAKRGKVFHMEPNGKGLKAISDLKGQGGESGMRKWFKRQLPFKILKQGISGLTDVDIDNKFKGLGIVMGWDSRFKRVFITKRDYTVRNLYKNKISYSEGDFFLKDGTKILLQDSKYFKDQSWTIAYSPMYGSWVSYYDFKPDYYIALNDYFKTGINYQKITHNNEQAQEDATLGLWSHLLTNKSYQVFYGKYYPFEIELQIKNTYSNNILKDMKLWTFSHRYHNNFDYAQWRKKTFNKLIVYNQTNNSGILNLHYDDSMNKSKYPISISQIEQGIQATHFDEYVSVNYMYNRVKNEENHVPIWNNDDNEIHKELNPVAISFNSKRVLERLRGDWFLVKMIQDNTSQFKQVFKWMSSREESYI